MSEEILLASIPNGYAIIDTGCTTSVIGQDCADRLMKFLQEHQMPLPERKQLPPVELKGFSGEATTTTEGLVWHVQLGKLWGTITTYVVPGRTAFLLSRRVLEGMEAQLNLGRKTLTSKKHGLSEMMLRQASNGHLLMPLWNLPDDWEPEVQLEESMPAFSNGTMVPNEDLIYHDNEPNVDDATAKPRNEQRHCDVKDCAATKRVDHPQSGAGISPKNKRGNGDKRPTRNDKRSALQHIAKNTKKGMVDLIGMKDSLKIIFGEDSHEIKHAYVAYRPRLERIPYSAATETWVRAIVTLSNDGQFHQSPWALRESGPERKGVTPTNLALFAYRNPTADHVPKTTEEHLCWCCNDCDLEGGDNPNKSDGISIEALYEEVDWVEPDTNKINPESANLIRSCIQSLKKTSVQMLLSRVLSEPDVVERDLKQWLGPQAHKLSKRVDLIEVFTDVAPLSKTVELLSKHEAIRIGQAHGHDLNRLRDRQLLLCLIAWTRPKHVWYSWPCSDWGPWSRFNMARSDQMRSEIMSRRSQNLRHLHVVAEAWNLQNLLKGYNHCENPLSSDAWKELHLVGEVYDIRIDQCALGLRCPKTNKPVYKPTRIVTTSPELARELQKYRCDRNHDHGHLEGKYKGKNLSAWAETYPKKFCRVVAAAMHREASVPADQPWFEELFAAESESRVEAPDLEELNDDDDNGDKPNGSRGSPLDAKNIIRADRAKAIVAKLHVNTGHSTNGQMMRLANRCAASEQVKQAIKNFKCSVCDELRPPAINRKVTMPHVEQPNKMVGLDFVQVELIRDDENGEQEEQKFNVLTCVCMATDFCQQVVIPEGAGALSQAFHEAWIRPYGAPETVYMDPAYMTLSKDFQAYLNHHNIQLLHCAAESHWQLGRLEVANRVLRGMAQRVWKSSSRPPKEIIEACSSMRNQLLRKCGYSPSQWFLGHDPKIAGWLGDVSEQQNYPVQSQVLSDPSFAAKIQLREEAARAFIAEHAKESWRRACAGRNRPLRGPYQVGQLVYMFRKHGRGSFKTRYGVWHGPGRIVGVESSTNHFIPRVVWIVYNGFIYRYSPEALRPVPDDEAEFRELAKDLAEGRLHPDVIKAEQSVSGYAGSYKDMIDEKPTEDDMELQSDLDDDDRNPQRKGEKRSIEGEDQIRRVQMRITRSSSYWQKRASGMPPLGTLHEGDAPPLVSLEQPSSKRLKTVPEQPQEERAASVSYEPSIAPSVLDDEMPDQALPADPSADSQVIPHESLDPEDNPPEISPNPDQPQEDNVSPAPETAAGPAAEENGPPPHIESDDEGLIAEHGNVKVPTLDVLEVSLDIHPEDITENPLCLWTVLDECLVAAPTKAQKRRVEVSMRKLSEPDKKLFEKAMQKEWQSWVENKVMSLVKSRGIDPAKVIKARWVLVWKKSSDPDDRTKTPKARLVLVGWQDPMLGKIATDSPTLRKESKSLVLSICSSKKWKLWGADIKTAFLSGDASTRELYFKPPKEIQQWMSLSDEDLYRLEKAAYGLAEAPRAWFLRLSREMTEAGLVRSSLDPCLFTLRRNGELKGICGVHVDDLLGGGEPEMDEVLQKLRKKLPFGDYRTFTIRYTGIEIRQNPENFSIEIGQESYIDALEPVATKHLGSAGTSLQDPGILRTCAGQLAWVSTATRPDQSFLSSYLQGVQDKGCVSHVQQYNKALREMKERKVCLRFPSNVPIDKWRIICIADAGWGTRSSGESQGGYILCLAHKDILERKRAPCWIVDWASKKLKRMVRSSVAAETLSSQNGLDAIESFQALLSETLYGMSPAEFRKTTPKVPSCLVVDSKGFYDAVTRSCCSSSISVERRLMIDYAIARETMEKQHIIAFWVNNLRMAADVLTKLKGDVRPLFEILEGGTYQIKVCLESGRKETARKNQEASGQPP